MAQKKYNRTIDQIITKCNTSFGAPMGRPNFDNRVLTVCNGVTFAQFNGKVFDCEIPLNKEGYEVRFGSVYWGIGKQLRVSYTKDLSYINFYRVRD